MLSSSLLPIFFDSWEGKSDFLSHKSDFIYPDWNPRTQNSKQNCTCIVTISLTSHSQILCRKHTDKDIFVSLSNLILQNIHVNIKTVLQPCWYLEYITWKFLLKRSSVWNAIFLHSLLFVSFPQSCYNCFSKISLWVYSLTLSWLLGSVFYSI